MILPIIVILILVASMSGGFLLDRKVKQVTLDPHTPLPARRYRRWQHKPTLAELEARSRQMEIEAGIGPEGAAKYVDELIAENNQLLGDPASHRKSRVRSHTVTDSIDRNRMAQAASKLNCLVCGGSGIDMQWDNKNRDTSWSCSTCGYNFTDEACTKVDLQDKLSARVAKAQDMLAENQKRVAQLYSVPPHIVGDTFGTDRLND